KPNWVRKASPSTFISLNDGFYGKDENFVFFGTACLPKAMVEHWTKIGGFYSKDDKRVFYMNFEIKGADYDSFEVVYTVHTQLAKDKDRCYWGDEVVDT